MRRFYEQYRTNVEAGPYYDDGVTLSDEAPIRASPVRLIAYYLPQFHTIPENDDWWGPGFTEWTNVTKSLPQYVGHLQPRLPANLGFYDLAHAETIRRQVSLAKKSGLDGFCIHNYWFGSRKILQKPLNILLDNPDIDIAFCLNWANEPWSRRWDGGNDDVLLEQHHSPDDDLAYANSILPAIRDPRYIRIGGRPLIMLYRPGILPDARATVQRWRAFFIQHGAGDPYVVMPQAWGDEDPRIFGMDAAVGFPPHGGGWDLPNEKWAFEWLNPDFRGKISSYELLARHTLGKASADFKIHPGVCPGWDSTARKAASGAMSFYGAIPASYGRWLEAACKQAASQSAPEEQLVFINAWNEWAEGAVLEPDRHFGHAFLAQTRRVVEGRGDNDLPHLTDRAEEQFLRPSLSIRHLARNTAWRAIKRVERTLAGR